MSDMCPQGPRSSKFTNMFQLAHLCSRITYMFCSLLDPVRLNLSGFLSHNKTISSGLSAAKVIGRIARKLFDGFGHSAALST